MMPRMSGYEVLNHIRKTRTAYELPVLMLTAGKQSREMVAAFQAGANDYLTKPIDRLELIARIKTQLLNKPLSVIMLDIDFFKAINDRPKQGHCITAVYGTVTQKVTCMS
jgi:PleD family two-component response regulator